MRSTEAVVGMMPDILSTIGHREGSEHDVTQEEVLASAEALMNSPAERMTQEINVLIAQYRERMVADRFWHSGGVDEVRFIATRTPDGRQLEEIFTINDAYSQGLKNYLQRSYQIEILDEAEQRQTLITITPAGETIINDVEGRPDDAVLLDFFYRTLIAEQRHARRSDDEKHQANESAKAMLNHRIYGVENPVFAGKE